MSEQETEQVEATEEQEQEEKEISEEEKAYNKELEVCEQEKNEVDKVNDKWEYSAKEHLEKLADLAKEIENEDGIKLSDQDIRQKIIHDCKHMWKRDTILDALPDWLKREREIESEEEEQEAPAIGQPKEVTEVEDQEALIKDLKTQIKQLEKQVTHNGKLMDKDTKKIKDLTEEIEGYKKQAKELKENTKLLDEILDIYDKKIHALTFTVTGASITKLLEFAEKEPTSKDNAQITIKLTAKGHVIDSIL